MKPILFSTPMVQAILDGRKTQTRRIVKANIVDRFVLDDGGNILGSYTEGMPEVYPTIDDAPYQEGDILWVRETFCEVPYEHNHVPIKGGHITTPKYAYKADSERDYTGIWRPSIHMPREAARIFLRVANVRVERLQDITEEDAKAEGITSYWAEPHRDTAPFIGAAKELGEDLCLTRREAFQQLWEHINEKRGYGWDKNPWVWVIEFEKISKEEAKRLEGMK